MKATPLRYLCPCCGSVTRQPPILVSRPTELRAGDPLVFFATAWQKPLRGVWQGMDRKMPYLGRVLVTGQVYAKEGAVSLLIEPGKLWREGELQGVLL